MSSARIALFASLPLIIAASGCGFGSSTEGDSASDAVDSLETASAESALIAVALDEATAQMTAEQIAASAAGSAGKRFAPEGCVTATAKEARVAYQMARCRGPYGLLGLTGTLTIDFSRSGGEIVAKLTAADLSANGAVVDLDATATYTSTTTEKTMQVVADSEGTGARGADFARKGSYTASWDEGCFSLQGSWQTTVLARTWTTTVSKYRHCTGMCPAAGGVLTYSGGLSGVTVTVTWDGGVTASWMSSGGRRGAVVVSCGG